MTDKLGDGVRKRKLFLASVDRVEAIIIDRFQRWGWARMGEASQRQFAADLTRAALGLESTIEEQARRARQFADIDARR